MQPLPVPAAIRAVVVLETSSTDNRCPICFSLSLLCDGVFLDSHRQAKAYRTLGFLPFNSIAIVATDGGEVTKPTRLLLLRRIHTETSSAHVIQEVPDLCDHVGANLLPLLVR